MKKTLLGTYMVAVLLMLSTRCSQDETVSPAEPIQPTSESAERENEAGRRNDSKYISTPVTGTINGIAFTAEYRITEFVAENGVLYAVGHLTNISGDGLPAEVADLSSQQIKMPVDREASGSRASASGRSNAAAATQACDILFLQLGPLDLDLLGLQIHLDQVVLEIVAVPGAGNLLGNLLCAVTGLLDGVGALQAIAQLLNQIISIIGMLP